MNIPSRILAFRLFLTASVAQAQTTAFTYQGRLQENGSGVTGVMDFEFRIFTAISGGVPFGPVVTRNDLGVTNGLFTVRLDFGAAPFDGGERFLDISVRPGVSASAYTNLAPRQPITATPYAVRAANLTGPLPLSQLPAGVVTNNSTGLSLTGAFAGNGTGLTNLNITRMGSGGVGANLLRFIDTVGSQQVYLHGAKNLDMETENDVTFWAGHDLTATMDHDATVHVKHDSTITVDNNLTTTTHGSAIHVVDNNLATTVGNSLTATVGASLIANVGNNLLATVGSSINVSAANSLSILAPAGVGIGTQNPQAPLHVYSANNPTTLRLQSAGGFGAARLEFFSDPQGSGGEWRPGYIQSTDNGGFTGGLSFHVNGTGFANRLGDLEVMRILDGRVGINTPNPRTALDVGGGIYADFLGANEVSTMNLTSTGQSEIHNSTQDGDHTFTGSLRQMLTLGYSGFLTAGYGIGLQTNNFYFRSEADFSWFRGGSHRDTPYDPGSVLFFSGAELMRLSGGYLQVNGSGNEQAYLGGDGAGADIQLGSLNPGISTVALWNAGSGQAMDLVARSADFNGTVSFGAQTRQMLNLWGTGYGIGVQASTLYFRCNAGGPNEGFSWYKGGAHNDNYANPGGGTELMHLVAGGLYVNGTFVSSSDRNAKENFAAVNPREVLEKVVALPLSQWNYKTDTSSRHLGPMAQDFHAAFNLGTDDKHIATVDADGVALAAIQGLNQKVDSENADLRSENAELKRELFEIKQLLLKLSTKKD